MIITVTALPERLDVELAVLVEELHQVERGQVAGRVVDVHVLGAGVGGVDAAAVRAGVPVVDRRVELHAGVAALPGRLGDLAQEVARVHRLQRLAGGDGPQRPRRRPRRPRA